MVRQAIAALRGHPLVERMRAGTARRAAQLRFIFPRLVRRLAQTAVPALTLLALLTYEHLVSEAVATAARVSDLAAATRRRVARERKVPVYAAAVVVALLLGWIVGRSL